ncbi:MAG TPA: hypothetical protein VIK00_00915 [Candidatus Limnocylindrales bacterium]
MRRTGTSALALPATAIVASMWLALACAVGSPSAPPSIGQASPTAVIPTAGLPTASIAPPTAKPSTATPSVSPTVQTAEPPAGDLTVGALKASGHLGSYCWVGVCSDEFELAPKSSLPTLHVLPSAQLEFTLADGSGFVQWDASYSSAKMADLVSIDGGGSAYDPDSTATPPPDLVTAAFAAPPRGDWTLVVTLHFVDAAASVTGGSAVYSWHLIVQ